MTAVAVFNVDAPVGAVACGPGIIVCGDQLGAVHFLQMVLRGVP